MAKVYVLDRSQWLPHSPEDVFGFFADARNLEPMTPKFLRFRITTPMPIEMQAGTRLDYTLRLFGVPLRWRTHITKWHPNNGFEDVQERGPYALWHHTHTFEAQDEGTLMRDVVRYSMPLGPLGQLGHWLLTRRTLDQIFNFRRDAIGPLLAAHIEAKAASR